MKLLPRWIFTPCGQLNDKLLTLGSPAASAFMRLAITGPILDVGTRPDGCFALPLAPPPPHPCATSMSANAAAQQDAPACRRGLRANPTWSADRFILGNPVMLLDGISWNVEPVFSTYPANEDRVDQTYPLRPGRDHASRKRSPSPESSAVCRTIAAF